VALKKPSDFFGKKPEENNLPVVESDNSLRDELNKVESLSEQVTQLQQELSQKVVKNDLESLVLSQINTMQENFEYLQNDFRKSNKKDISEFKNKVSELTEIVGNLVEKELPKYKKQITNNEVRIGEKFDSLRESVEENIADIHQEINGRVENIVFAIDENLEHFNNQLQETSSEVKRTTETYNKLSKIVENKVSKENERLEEYSQVIQSLHEAFVELEASLQEETSTHLQVIEEKFETISLGVKNRIDNIDEEVESFKSKVSLEISNIKADVVINEQHLKNFGENIEEYNTRLEGVDKYLKENHQELIELKEEVFAEIEKLPLGDVQENVRKLERKLEYIEEVYKNIEPEVIVREVIQEGLLNEPPETKNSDPLTPLNKNFVTLEQLQEHYRLFINRIQQQLATLGGGGETRLRYLDDVVGVATNSSAYDGKYLQWNSTTNTAEFTDVTGAGVQVNSDWNATSGISSILNKPTIVNQIIAGTGITISPSNGIGTVTINATGGVGSATTGYYGSFYDTTTQYATGAATTTAVKLNTTAAANGFSIQSGSRIVAENAGVYNTQFSFQLDKSSGSSANTWIWLSKNGIDLPETTSTVAVQGTNAETVPAWNFIVDMIPGDYIEYKWMTDDVNIGITSAHVPSVGSPPVSVNIPDIPSAIVTIQQITGVIAGVGSTVQTLDQTLRYGNTSSLGFSVGVASVTRLSGVGNTYIGLSTSIIPTVASQISLGSSAFPFKDIVISAGTLTIADADPLVDGVAISNTAQFLQLSRGGFKILSGVGTLFQIDPFTGLVESAAPTIITNSANTSGVGSGSFQSAGGAYIAKDLRVGGNYYGNGATLSGIVTYLSAGTGVSLSANTGIVTVSTTYAPTSGYATTAGIATVAQGLTGTPNITVGVITATSYYGSGANLTGIVTYITAGTGISVNQNTGNVTITATGGGGGTQDLNTTLGYGNTSSLGMSVGISTFTSTSGTTVIVGGATTALVVNDNVYVTGITTTFREIITANATNTYAPLYLSGNPTSTPPSAYGLISVGALNYNDTNNIAGFTDNVNNYTQVVAQNKNSGNNASTDFIVANNTAGPNSYYGDFGINASGFSGTGPWDDPNGTYLYASAGSLSLGTDDAKDVRIATGSASNSPVTRITVKGTTGNVGIGSTLPNYGFVVQGSVHFHDGFYDSTDSIGAANAILSNTGVSSATKWITSPSFTGLNVTGVITATSFSGSGVNLTGIVTYITAGNGISVNQNTGNVTITGTGVTSGSSTTYTGNNTFSGITTFSGNVVSTGVFQIQQAEETYNTYNTSIGAGATVALDCSTGNTFYITSTVSGNWTANLTNLSLSANCITNVTLMIIQGVTAYVPNALQIGGTTQTINWQGGSIPTGNNSKKDAIAFTIFYTGSAYNVFGQLVTFG